MARSGHFPIGDPILTAATLLLFVGACGKSAQLPLYVWLPDAMEGPTPVSALIHAATMVTAGVYMVARSNAIVRAGADAMKTVAIVGALTAIFAASIGLVQNDIKRVLAYSTVSQLGYMFLALGVGAFAAGVFHVFTHAFFKALLFLGAGSVIHAMSGEQDMRNMGDLRERIPMTYWTMFIATLAIAGIPPFAGFFSKDEILWQAWTSEGGAYRLLWVIGYATALMTAFYMFRLVYLTFRGRPRMSHEVEHHIHESPKSMTVPLVDPGLLRDLRRMAGLAAQPGRIEIASRSSSNRCSPRSARCFGRGRARPTAAGEKEEEHTSGTEYFLMVLLGRGRRLQDGAWRGSVLSRCRQRLHRAHRRLPRHRSTTRLSTSITWMKAYDYAFTGRRKVGDVRLGVMGLGEASSWFESHVVDGAVNAAGWIDPAIRDAFQLVGQVDHRRHWRERPGDSGTHVVLSGAAVRVGPGAVVCAGHGRRDWWDSFFITCTLRRAASLATSF